MNTLPRPVFYGLIYLVILPQIGCNLNNDTSEQTNAKSAQRYLWVTGLKPKKAEYYKELHSKPWPGVTERITASNIKDMSIHQHKIEGKPYLFLYLEYVGDDFEADMAAMAADPDTQRWWKETDPCQVPLPEAEAIGKIWSDTTELFYHP